MGYRCTLCSLVITETSATSRHLWDDLGTQTVSQLSPSISVEPSLMLWWLNGSKLTADGVSKMYWKACSRLMLMGFFGIANVQAHSGIHILLYSVLNMVCKDADAVWAAAASLWRNAHLIVF